jgi:predicted transposase/invertase (TIGR01784 family)
MRRAALQRMNEDDRPPLLDPKNDLVFKFLFQDDMELLASLIDAVVDLPGPIRSIEVRNVGIPQGLPSDKHVVLDVRLMVEGFGRINIEMQRINRPASRERFLYYWAKEYDRSLKRGQDYTQLVPVVSILWLDYVLSPHTPYHSVYQLCERTTGVLYSSHLQIHTLELPKYVRGKAVGLRAGLDGWSRFFCGTDAERAFLSEGDTLLKKAMTKLRTLSYDDNLRELAWGLERDADYFAMYDAQQRSEARAEGLEEGRQEGRQEADKRQRGPCCSVWSVCGLGLFQTQSRRRLRRRMRGGLSRSQTSFSRRHRLTICFAKSERSVRLLDGLERCDFGFGHLRRLGGKRVCVCVRTSVAVVVAEAEFGHSVPKASEGDAEELGRAGSHASAALECLQNQPAFNFSEHGF